MNTGVIDRFTEVFTRYIDSGFGLLGGYGRRTRLLPPVENFVAQLPDDARAAIGDFLAAAVIGGPETVRAGFERLAEATQVDEFMLVSDVFDPDLRLRSLDIAAAAMAS